MFNHRHHFGSVPARVTTTALVLLAVSASAQVNDWISPISGDWDNAANWSAGLPDASQSEIRIINPNSKAVAIQPITPVNFPNSMTVQNLNVGGVPPDQNVLLLNFFGTTPALRVLKNLNIEANGRVLMLYSGLNVSNALNLHGILDQEGGQLAFTNSFATTMQIEGGHFNLTNGLVTGANMYLGGTNDGFVNQDSGLVSLAWLEPGVKPGLPGSTGAGTYVLQSGWLIVSLVEVIGETGFGTLTQNGGTNSSPRVDVGKGTYVKTGGGLFAGEITVAAPSEPIFAPPTAILTHAGGTAMVTNVLRLIGQSNRLSPRTATFNMLGGSLWTPRIQLEQAALFTQKNGTVNVANELFVNDNGGRVPSHYQLSGGSLFSARTTISSTYPESSYFNQSGGTHIVTNTVWINGNAIYQLSGGTVTVPNIVLTGTIYPPQFFVFGAPAYAITNQTISLTGGAVVIQDSAQQFGRLTLTSDAGINLAGDSAILRFADSHTNSWQSELQGDVPKLAVYNWNGSTTGGGTDQLSFGTSGWGLTSGQLAQIRFVNPAGFPPGTYPSRILPSGEVVPMPLPVLGLINNGTPLMLSWSSGYILQGATNAVGPYVDLTNVSPYSVDVHQFQMEFFRLRN